MRLEWLADAFRAEGLTVVEEPGWKARGRDWRSGEPSGLMQHHTAPPVPYPVKKLYLTRPAVLGGAYAIKCNFNIKPDGTVHVIAAGRCNYSSGKGSKRVLNEVRADVAPSGSARSRGLIDNWGGNPYYINDETDHAGDRSPIPAAQYRAVVLTKVAILRRLEYMTSNRLIAHAEHTRRKIDPRWDNGQTTPEAHRNMVQLRADVQAVLDGGPGPVPPPTEEDYMYPIRRGDGAADQRPERKQDVQHFEARLAALGTGYDSLDGVADQEFLDAVFAVVGSPAGGSYFSGEEGAVFEQRWVEHLAGGAHDHDDDYEKLGHGHKIAGQTVAGTGGN